MIRQLKNIDTAFKHIRLFSAVLIIACTCICCYCIYFCVQKVSDAQQKVYVIAEGKVLEAIGFSKKDNIPIEARDHIKVFHHYFLTLSPDEQSIESNIKKALYLADGSAKQQYDLFKEQGFYTAVISGNVSQQVDCDSISLNMQTYPYYFKYYGKQQITRPTVVIIRNMITEGYLRDLNERTENNPHGFLIERWNTIDNAILSTTKR